MIKLKVSMKCSLCDSKTKLFYKIENEKYYKCINCSSVMLDPVNYVTSKEEKKRYEIHNNDIEDIGYQQFVSPVIKSIKEYYTPDHIGLDYGAGTGPVITTLLEEQGYNINLYDPYFHHYPENLNKKYDYIICCEVIEHFYNPYDEFNSLTSMLNIEGSIFCMTSLYDEDINFKTWYYKNDETHVFFYHKRAIEWIKNKFEFTEVNIAGKLIKFSK